MYACKVYWRLQAKHTHQPACADINSQAVSLIILPQECIHYNMSRWYSAVTECHLHIVSLKSSV